MKYKLLVLDLDGTLTNSKKVITEHTRTTLIEAQKRGLKIVLASGRPTYGDRSTGIDIRNNSMIRMLFDKLRKLISWTTVGK